MLLHFAVRFGIARLVKIVEKKAGLEHSMAARSALEGIYSIVNAYRGRGGFTKKNRTMVKSNLTYWINKVPTVD